MFIRNNLNGLGMTVYLDPTQPWLGTKEVPDTNTSTTQKTSLLDSLTNLFKAAAPVVSGAQSVVNQVKSGNTTLYNPALPNQTPPPPAPAGMSMGTKIAIGAGLAAVTGLVIYSVSKNTRA